MNKQKSLDQGIFQGNQSDMHHFSKQQDNSKFIQKNLSFAIIQSENAMSVGNLSQQNMLQNNLRAKYGQSSTLQHSQHPRSIDQSKKSLNQDLLHIKNTEERSEVSRKPSQIKLTDLANERMARLQLDNSKEGQQRQAQQAQMDRQRRQEILINSNSASKQDLQQQELNVSMPQIQAAKRTGMMKQGVQKHGRKDSFFNVNNMNQTVEFDGRF